MSSLSNDSDCNSTTQITYNNAAYYAGDYHGFYVGVSEENPCYTDNEGVGHCIDPEETMCSEKITTFPASYEWVVPCDKDGMYVYIFLPGNANNTRVLELATVNLYSEPFPSVCDPVHYTCG